ncbi:MAG: electron transport complex subunit E [Desulfobacteraceae bacterium]|jgi:electron transport complex protein RnfE|uniref:Ion-translocating oxidoreductase complex subunit E n=1 Tax=Candidatus Desulfacyla euxinica TaxID=2841693 RepID=A0A8J6MZ29_9DELT|nr:electron transport complex subunit E [Candidatus Desulfacyla euxinica]MBL6977840.1 electron transport complex subunit E [Desulfobacteraceae bacterium]MBW1869857.1 electron transport complex subunit E [Deltaproteobacteria bacterium]MBW2204872.1 electron transport complex subunit E [Deltaproteobacteria bacterium]
MAKTAVQEFTKGLWAEIPPFRLVLGLCPVLAVTKTVENGIGMGVATTFVLICSNILISLLRNVIPKKVRIACFIVVIATFVTVVELVMQAFAYPLFLKLGIFIPLIVVNCIVLGRAEAFAAKNGVVASFADGLGIGVGFTLSLTALAIVREILGNGTFYDIPVFGPTFEPFSFMVQAPGAFVCLGLMLCIMNMLGKK